LGVCAGATDELVERIRLHYGTDFCGVGFVGVYFDLRLLEAARGETKRVKKKLQILQLILMVT